MNNSNKFMIGPVGEGLTKDIKPWATPNDSFEVLQNAYQFRGRIIRKSGYILLGRLQRQLSLSLGNTDGTGNFLINLRAALGLGVNSSIVLGSITVTIGNQVYTEISPPNGLFLETIFPNPSTPAAPGTFINYATTDLGIVTSPPLIATPVSIVFSFYPGLPVMGLRTRELFGINLEALIAFDTTTSYSFNGTNFIILSSVMPVTWSGTNYQFFWTINYASAFWATNSKPGLHGAAISNITNAANPLAQVTTTAPHGFSTGQTVVFINVGGMTQINGLSDTITVTGPTTFTLNTINTLLFNPYTSNGIALNSQVSVTGQDGIRYYANVSNNLPSGVVGVGLSWVNYNPPIDPNTALVGCLLMFAYRGYLVFLNTTEGNEQAVFNYPNRARWTQIGTPYYSNPVPNTPSLQGVDPFAVRDDLFGRGGANDAPTNEAIVGAGFIRDILVVYFERSTWRLRFVNNSQNPFVWERVNQELGSDCTFSSIIFDKGLINIGDRGIVISDGNDTSRIDEKIPDDIFNIRQANQGFQRVYGIRTFQTKLLYWTYPSSTNPNGTFPDLVLVYNYDSKNWSYFDDTFTCFGYFYPGTVAETWADMIKPWNTYDYTWDSGLDSFGFESLIAGNQQGFVLQLERDNAENDTSLSISSIAGSLITSADHNMPDGTWISLSGIIGTTSIDGVSLNGRNFKISNPGYNTNNFTLQEFKPIVAGNASGTNFGITPKYNIGYVPIIAGSVQINVGTLVFIDTNLDGILYIGAVPSGTINYITGALVLNFSPPIAPTPVNIRVVSYSDQQLIEVITTTGTYSGGGLISRISNFDIETKLFNFFGDDKRARLSKIDFYLNQTQHGQFSCNVLSDSSETIINEPLDDNPQSNVVLSSKSPYQYGSGDQTIFRLFADCVAQTVQVQLTMSDRQLAVSEINSSGFELLAMIFTMKRGGRII